MYNLGSHIRQGDNFPCLQCAGIPANQFQPDDYTSLWYKKDTQLIFNKKYLFSAVYPIQTQPALNYI